MRRQSIDGSHQGWAVDLSEAITWLRELSVEELAERGLSVRGTFDEVDDPVLLGPDGEPVDSWREGHPYDERMSSDEYETTTRNEVGSRRCVSS